MATAHAPALHRSAATIAPERLESCIRRIDPADRALLDLSLNRGIPDWALAPVVKTDPMRLAWKRARAIECVASRMGLTDPGDLGAVRDALIALPDRAWLPLELQPAPQPPVLEPPEPAGAEPRVVRSTQALAPREAAPAAGKGMRSSAPAAARSARGRSFARRAAGAMLVGAAAALALRRR
jgi:hypothetical protein